MNTKKRKRAPSLPQGAISRSSDATPTHAINQMDVDSDDNDQMDAAEDRRKRPTPTPPLFPLVMDIVAWNVQRKLNKDNIKSSLACRFIGDCVIDLLSKGTMMIFFSEVNRKHGEFVKYITDGIKTKYSSVSLRYRYIDFPGKKQATSECGFLAIWNESLLTSEPIITAFGNNDHITRPVLEIHVDGHTYCGVHLKSGKAKSAQEELLTMMDNIKKMSKKTLFLGDMNIGAAEPFVGAPGTSATGEVPIVVDNAIRRIAPINAQYHRFCSVFPASRRYTHGAIKDGKATYTLLDFGFSNFGFDDSPVRGKIEPYYPYTSFTFTGNYPDHMPIGFRVYVDESI